MKKFADEFREFIAKGNVMDMAVGVIIGGAFGKIASSLVENILMPLIGILLGGVSFENLAVTVGTAEVKYGIFLQSVFDFLIIAFVIFVMIKQIAKVTDKFKKKKKLQRQQKRNVLSVSLRLISMLQDVHIVHLN